MQLKRVPNDPEYRMHCPVCGPAQTKFNWGTQEVEIHSEASDVPMIARSDGTHMEFKKGQADSVTCAKCGATYRPEDAFSTT
jgi:RNA polymerase subunit RPABC4/transcription elongation factor Spt4